MSPQVHRTGIVLTPDKSRVLFRPFVLASEQRIQKIVARVLALPEDTVLAQMDHVMAEFYGRHQRLAAYFDTRFRSVRSHLLTDSPISQARQRLIGAYFTQEYSLESAALFNPSMVWHPDQSGLAPGSRRFILSLRATGEGHISSVAFRTGTVDAECRIQVDTPSRFVTAAEVVPDSTYETELFRRKLAEMDLLTDFARTILERVNETFTHDELQRALASRTRRSGDSELNHAMAIRTLALSNYDLDYDPDTDLSERVIFPSSPSESNGIEDARFVQFTDDDGSTRYMATYTAYNGRAIQPQLIETDDFCRFHVGTLNGAEVQNKGLALFPRRVNGQFAMLSRQDNESIYLMFSDQLHFWQTRTLLARPTYPWEYVQLGNCGSPIELAEGWLVLTHGVGPMRRYAIGAMLLDKDDPTRVIGRLAEPLLSPDANEREGYVPNVVYSCGAALFNETLIIPYAMSDYASTFATVPIAQILAAMV
jgi:predicted GH43/DUF377 family glycosyl hydrolase